VKVWKAEATQQTPTLKGRFKSVSSVSFSPDGQRIVSGSSDKTVKVWTSGTGRLKLTMKGYPGPIENVSFNLEGRRIISVSGGRTLNLSHHTTGLQGYLTRTMTPEYLQALEGHLLTVTSVSFSPDRKRIVSGSQDKTIKIWDCETGQELLTLKGHTSRVDGVAFSPDGERIVSGAAVPGEASEIKVWDAETGQEMLRLQGPHRVTSVTFSPDGKRLVAAGDATIKVWDARPLEESQQK